MDSEAPVVRPKTGQSERPYSVSKDEAYARLLQSEEDSIFMNSDEEFARQLQDELNIEERRKMRESIASRPAMRAMTPITQLFSSLVGASSSGWNMVRNLEEDSDHEQDNDVGGNESSDSDSTLSGATASTVTTPTTNTTSTASKGQKGSTAGTSSKSGATNKGRGRGTSTKATRGLHGMRPLETTVTERPSAGSTRGRGAARGRRGQGATRGGTGGARGSRSGSTADSEPGETRITGNRRAVPRTMEPIAPPVSLAINQPELPEGEIEPEILILDQGAADPNNRYIHIMRDPMLLLLLLMGRAPNMMVPDDVDASDYESLWELAEQLGEVKNRGMGDKELASLPCKMYHKRTRLSEESKEQPECRVCLNVYMAGDSICTLPCQGKHEFHAKCVKEWLKRNASCPICRFELKPS